MFDWTLARIEHLDNGVLGVGEHKQDLVSAAGEGAQKQQV